MLSKVCVLLAIVAFVNCLDNCGTDEACKEKQIVSLIDDLDQEESLNLFGGLSVQKIAEAQSKPVGADEGVVERTQRYLESHELKFKIETEEEESARSMSGEARTSKLKKLIVPLLLGLKLKLAILLPLALSAIALISFKGLGAGLLALLFSGATALKDLLAAKHSQPQVTYVSAPESHGDWGRTGQSDLPYSGYQTLPQ